MGTLVSPPRFMKAVWFGSWLSFHTFRRQRLAVRHFPLVSSLVGEVSAKVGFYSKEKLVLDLGNLKSKVRVNKEHALPVIQFFFLLFRPKNDSPL